MTGVKPNDTIHFSYANSSTAVGATNNQYKLQDGKVWDEGNMLEANTVYKYGSNKFVFNYNSSES